MKSKVITLLLFILSFNFCYSQHKQHNTPKKHKKSKVEINTQLLTVGGGIMFITAGTLAITTRGDKPFIDNGTKWKVCPSEWAIIGGFTVVTFGVTFRF